MASNETFEQYFDHIENSHYFRPFSDAFQQLPSSVHRPPLFLQLIYLNLSSLLSVYFRTIPEVARTDYPDE